MIQYSDNGSIDIDASSKAFDDMLLNWFIANEVAYEQYVSTIEEHMKVSEPSE